MKNCGVKTKQMSKPETLELAKILRDTSYLGTLSSLYRHGIRLFPII